MNNFKNWKFVHCLYTHYPVLSQSKQHYAKRTEVKTSNRLCDYNRTDTFQAASLLQST